MQELSICGLKILQSCDILSYDKKMALPFALIIGGPIIGSAIVLTVAGYYAYKYFDKKHDAEMKIQEVKELESKFQNRSSKLEPFQFRVLVDTKNFFEKVQSNLETNEVPSETSKLGPILNEMKIWPEELTLVSRNANVFTVQVTSEKPFLFILDEEYFLGSA